MKKDILYLIEFRVYINDEIESDPVFLASTMEKAKQFMENNKDYDGTNRNFWWAVYPIPVDVEPLEVDGLDGISLYNPDVDRIYWQYENVVKLNQIYSFNLNEGDHNYLSDFRFEGELVDTENDKVVFRNIKCYKNNKLVETKKSEIYKVSELHGLWQ